MQSGRFSSSGYLITCKKGFRSLLNTIAESTYIFGAESAYICGFCFQNLRIPLTIAEWNPLAFGWQNKLADKVYVTVVCTLNSRICAMKFNSFLENAWRIVSGFHLPTDTKLCAYPVHSLASWWSTSFIKPAQLDKIYNNTYFETKSVTVFSFTSHFNFFNCRSTVSIPSIAETKIQTVKNQFWHDHTLGLFSDKFLLKIITNIKFYNKVLQHSMKLAIYS